MRFSLYLSMVILVMGCMLMGCSKEEIISEVSLVVTVRDEDSNPVDGAKIVVDGKARGVTSRGGVLETRVGGPEGRSVGVAVECPIGWNDSGPEQRNATVRFLRPLSGESTKPAPMKMFFDCVRKQRQVVLLVRTKGGEGLSVRALGKELVKLDDDGVAQTIIEGIPGEEVEVSIDTNPNPRLRPRGPSRRLVIPKDSQIIVFDQNFETKRKRARTRKRTRRSKGPRRI